VTQTRLRYKDASWLLRGQLHVGEHQGTIPFTYLKCFTDVEWFPVIGYTPEELLEERELGIASRGEEI
jgi:hypothetical protein